MVFLWRLSDSKSPQVSRTLLIILAALNNSVVWMVLIRPPISKIFGLLFKPLRTVPSSRITIVFTVTIVFHSFLISLARSKYLSLFLLSLIFTLWSAWTATFSRQQFFCLLWIIARSSLLTGIRLSILSQNSKQFNASHSLGRILVCTRTICILWSNFNLAQFPVDDLFHPAESSLTHPLRWFVMFTYVIYGFVSIITKPTLSNVETCEILSSSKHK